MLSFQDVQITEASATNATFEDLLVRDIIDQSQHSFLTVCIARRTRHDCLHRGGFTSMVRSCDIDTGGV